jgi:short subunit dehydrogenase-like uncharacterized protein
MNRAYLCTCSEFHLRTGQLCALYVANTYSGQGLKWGIAGRSLNKLEELKTRLVNIDPALSKLPVLVADNADEDALRRMCEQSKVCEHVTSNLS